MSTSFLTILLVSTSKSNLLPQFQGIWLTLLGSHVPLLDQPLWLVKWDTVMARSGTYALLHGQEDGILWLTAMMNHMTDSRRSVSPKEVARAPAGHVIPGMPESCFSPIHSFPLRSTHYKRQRQIKSQLYYYYYFGRRCMACGILVSQPGIEPMPPAVETWSLDHWTTREDQLHYY